MTARVRGHGRGVVGNNVMRSVLVVWGAVGWAPSMLAAQERPRTAEDRDTTAIVLRPIEITVTRRSITTDRAPAAVTVVDGAALRRGRVTAGLDEALGQVPGLYIANRYNPSLDQRIAIRGFGARSAFGARGVKVLLDGIPQTLPDGQGQLTNVDVGTLGSVQVLRGAASSLYGNAAGGVVALETVVAEGRSASLRSVAGAYGFWKTSMGLSAPVGSGTVAFRAARTTTDGYRDHSRTTLNHLSARLRQEIGAGASLLVTAHLARHPVLDNPGSLNADEVATDPRQANQRNVNAGAGKDLTQAQLGVRVRTRLGPETTVDVVAFGLRRDLENPLSFAYIDLDRWAYGARAEVAGALGPGLRYTAGLDLQRQRDDRREENPDRTAVRRDQLEQVTEWGPFAQLAWDPHRRVSIVGGVRFDAVRFQAHDRLVSVPDASESRVLSQISWSGGIVVRAHESIRPYVNVGTSFETPTTTELGNRPTGAGGFNPDLEPQTALNVEVGVRGRVAPWLTYEVAAYTIDVEGALIPFEVPAVPGRTFFRNAGATRHRGLEVGATLVPVRSLSIVAAYTRVDHTFTDFSTADGVFDGNHIPGIPRHRWFGSAEWRTGVGGWVAVDGRVVSSAAVDDANQAVTEGWATADLRAGWDGVWRGWGVEPFVGVQNVFDRRYVGSMTVNARFGRYFEPSPPRNAYVGLAIRPVW